MGEIKDLVDLVTQLYNNVKNRKFADELRKIQSMIGSIQSEHAIMHEQRINLMTENAELKKTIVTLEDKISSPNQEIANNNNSDAHAIDKLPKESEQILMIIASNRGRITKDIIIRQTGLSTAKVDFFFDKLLKHKFITRTSGRVGGSWSYRATPSGREYLANQGLLE
jgi:predicted nuclease with TOPRIM domain